MSRPSSASRWTRAPSTPRASGLRAEGAGSDVPASVTYSGATATLNPNADLAPGTVYHVTVAGSVTDASGNALGADDTWSFTTEAASLTDTTTADFGAGSHRHRHLRLRDRPTARSPWRRPWARSSPADLRFRPAGRADLGVAGRRGRRQRHTRPAGPCTSTAPSPAPTRPRVPATRSSSCATFGAATFQHAASAYNFRERLCDLQHQGQTAGLRPHQLRRRLRPDTPVGAWSAARTATGSSGTRTRSATTSTETWWPPTAGTFATAAARGRQRLQRRGRPRSPSTGCG